MTDVIDINKHRKKEKPAHVVNIKEMNKFYGEWITSPGYKSCPYIPVSKVWREAWLSCEKFLIGKE